MDEPMDKKTRKMARRATKEVGRRAREEPRFREFPYLGWTLFFVPMDLLTPAAPYVPVMAGGLPRNIARMLIGEMWGFGPDDLISLRERRIQFEGEEERTWWVIACPKAVADRRKKPAS
jgi:hypothetical protein